MPKPPRKESWEDELIRRKQSAASALSYLRLMIVASKKERTRFQSLHAGHGINTPQMQRALCEALRRKFGTELSTMAARYGVPETEAALVTLKFPLGFERVPEGQIQYEMFGARRGTKG